MEDEARDRRLAREKEMGLLRKWISRIDRAGIWRSVNSIGWIAAIVIGIANYHSLETCQAKLYTSVTGQEAPTHKELHEGEHDDEDKQDSSQ